MALKQQIQEELGNAMKAGEELKVSVLRMLKASVLKFEVSGERKEASDEDVMQIIMREIKQRRDSEEQFRNGDRAEMADKEAKEIEILMAYMPPQLGEDEILAFAKEAIAAVGAVGKADTGKVMAALMPKVKGKADGAAVSRIVGDLLGG